MVVRSGSGNVWVRGNAGKVGKASRMSAPSEPRRALLTRPARADALVGQAGRLPYFDHAFVDLISSAQSHQSIPRSTRDGYRD